MNENPYSMPEDIENTVRESQELVQGRLNAQKWLRLASELQKKGSINTIAWGDEPSMRETDFFTLIAKAALHSSNNKISELERELEEVKGQAKGLKFQLDERNSRIEEELRQHLADTEADLRKARIEASDLSADLFEVKNVKLPAMSRKIASLKTAIMALCESD